MLYLMHYVRDIASGRTSFNRCVLLRLQDDSDYEITLAFDSTKLLTSNSCQQWSSARGVEEEINASQPRNSLATHIYLAPDPNDLGPSGPPLKPIHYFGVPIAIVCGVPKIVCQTLRLQFPALWLVNLYGCNLHI